MLAAQAAAERLRSELDACPVPLAARWVDTEELCRAALAEDSWDAVIATWPPLPALDLLRRERDALLLVLVADMSTDNASAPGAARFDDVLRDAQRLRAVLCKMERGQAQLGVIFEQLLGANEERAQRRELAAFEAEHVRILERLASGAPLSEVLERIVRLFERHSEGLCSIVLLDRVQGRIHHAAAPSLPPSFVHAIDGAPIGPKAGSCGAAAYWGERVIVRDIATHPYWVDYEQLALPVGLRACWSSPIFSSTREVLGTFAVYYREPREPTRREIQMVDSATHLAALAIMRAEDERSLRLSERRYRQLLETSHEGVVMLDLEGHVGFVNPRAAHMLGYQPDQIVGRHLNQLLHPSEREPIAALLTRGKQAISQQHDVRMRGAGGHDCWTIVAASSIVNETAEVTGMLCMLTDIGERKRAEEELSRSEAELRAIFEGAAMGVALTDASTRIVQSNPVLERMLGYGPEELAGKTLLALTHPSDLNALKEKKRLLDAGNRESSQIESRLLTKLGAAVWARITVSPLPAGGLSWPSIVVMLEVISESKRLEAAVRSEERLRALIYESVSDVIYYLAVEALGRYRFLSVNPAFCVATGLSMGQVSGRLLEEVIPAESRPLVSAHYQRAIQARRTVRWEEVSTYPSGTKYGEVSITPIFDAEGVCTNLVGAVRDITERKHADAKIAEQAALLDRARDAIVQRGMDHAVRFWNDGAVRLYGHSREEALGRPITSLLYRDTSAFENAQRQLLVNGAWSGELVHYRKDGQALVVESSWTLLRDQAGRPESVLAIHTDVTEKKKLQAQLGLAQRMESLGTLAGGIAHDFNNILGAITGYLTLAMEELPKEHAARELLEVVQEASRRALDLVEQILTFSRRREPRRVRILLQPVIDEALRLLRASLPAMMEIRAHYEPETFSVLADASQIHQIVMNLGTNAAHAVRERGTLEVNLASVTLHERLVGVASEAGPGRYARLCVRDDGAGMDAATLSRVFEPFFTTKPPGEGTGLGLSVVLGIVKEHGGALTVASAPGIGTTFEIYLPEAQVRSEVASAPAPAPEDGRGAGECVLCVDDDEIILQLELRALERLGYRAMGYREPAAALRAFEAHPQTFAAIVSDFAMPVMSGLGLARAALHIRPDIPIIMTSGHLPPAEFAEARSLGVREFVSKPELLEALGPAVSRVVKADAAAPDRNRVAPASRT